MNPSYRLMLDVYVIAMREPEDVKLRRVQYLPFVPRAGDVLQFTNDAEETIDLQLEEVVYSLTDQQFTGTIQDDGVREAAREGAGVLMGERIKMFESFGFLRYRDQ